jgi:hypothetical protein
MRVAQLARIISGALGGASYRHGVSVSYHAAAGGIKRISISALYHGSVSLSPVSSTA